MTDREVIVGSCNYTDASQSNVERGAAARLLPEAAVIQQKEWFERLFEATGKFNDGLGEAMPPTPPR